MRNLLSSLSCRTGEEIIATISYDESGNIIHLKNPLMIIENFDPDTHSKYWALGKYLQYSKQDIITINPAAVIYTSELIDEIVEYYQKQLIVMAYQKQDSDGKNYIRKALDYIDSMIERYQNNSYERGPSSSELDEIEEGAEADQSQEDEFISETDVAVKPKSKYLH